LSGRKLIIELNTFIGLVADPLAVVDPTVAAAAFADCVEPNNAVALANAELPPLMAVAPL